MDYSKAKKSLIPYSTHSHTSLKLTHRHTALRPMENAVTATTCHRMCTNLLTGFENGHVRYAKSAAKKYGDSQPANTVAYMEELQGF